MIRKASDKDYPVLIDIWESAVLATHDFLSKQDFEDIKNKLPFYFRNVDLYVFMGDNENVQGFLGVSTDKIEMLFIDDKYRGKGIGKALMMFAIDTLYIRKVDVNEQNIPAVGFYERFGFKVYQRSPSDGEGKDYPILHLSL